MSGHDHGASSRTRLGIALGLTALVFFAEVVGAWLTRSLALFVDAAHMLTDVTGLTMALVAASLMHRPASDRHTWGLRRLEVLSAAAQAALLFAVGVYAIIEGVRRLLAPPEVAADLLLVFGVVGLVANLIAMAVLLGGRNENLNLRAAFLEVLNDALGSLAVIVSAVLALTLGLYRADAVAAIFIAALIVPRTLLLLREAIRMLLEATPRGLDLDEVREHILHIPHVLDVHDLHASNISSDLPVLTAHVVVEDECFADGHAADMLGRIHACVQEHFPVRIDHATIQIEPLSHTRSEQLHHD